MVYCVYSLESPQWDDSNENTQHTLMSKKIKKISLLSPPPLTWRYIQPSLAGTTPVSNKFSWSQLTFDCTCKHWKKDQKLLREVKTDEEQELRHSTLVNAFFHCIALFVAINIENCYPNFSEFSDIYLVYKAFLSCFISQITKKYNVRRHNWH